ncbi:soluble lytic murein transglycosylase [Azospirillum fermentarium]|uniref:lytic transglycosylase domain-containing protein n=1 Tax=Azospirillum fermentarium TaxID=1233114 RepID=UPI002226D71F|nr:lytic transglycosylase domain-containing protein [Azospirillum fermentarium]MCW2246286.1 soluble lytic murein transglycosylase [Azospirillum fermentarium]
MRCGIVRSGMAAALALFLAFGAAPALAQSAADLTLYRNAFKAADNDRHDEALRMLQGAPDRLPGKIVRWMKLAAPGAGFPETAAFIRENPGWPNLAALRRGAEAAMPDTLPDAQVLAWFRQYAPLTTAGVMRYADALAAAGERDAAARVVRTHWIEADIAPADEQAMLIRYRDLLRRQDHVARLDHLLWDRQEAAARRLLPLVPDGYDDLIAARMALFNGVANAEALAARVPSPLRDDAGLAYDWVRYLRRKGDDEGAAERLSNPPDKVVRPSLWWAERNIIIRRLLDRGDNRLAYRLAMDHRQDDGVGQAEAEFLAGFIALRRLNRPGDALEHFQTVYKEFASPITRARGAFWAGKAAEAAGSPARAAEWYSKAAQYGVTFYGQLAANEAGVRVRLPAEPKAAEADAVAFEKRELVRAARLLYRIQGKSDDRAAMFLRRIALDAKDGEELHLAARLARDIGRPDLAIAAAKDKVQEGIFLTETGYPTIDLSGIPAPEGPLVLSLIRQESTFNPLIVSSAGARGLMQLMPQTAQLVASKLGIKHTQAKLTADPRHNVRLGSAYIADMLDRYNGSYVLAIASYNAGPNRVRQWLDQFGDPRTEAVDVLDWIELIPFSETRNYVQRVMEATIVYRARLQGARADLDLARLLHR